MQGLAGKPADDAVWLRVEAAGIELAEAGQRLLAAGGTGLNGRDVHALRVICKRLRALWRMLEADFTADVTRPPERALRDVARMLAGQREASVRIKTLARLARKADSPRKQALAGRFGVALASVLETSATLCTPEPQMRAVFADQIQRLRALGPPPTTMTLAAGITDSMRRARKSGRRALASGDVERWHRCRKWVKYEHYQLELCMDLRGRWERRHDRLQRLGVLLGRYNDLEDLACYLDRLSAGFELPPTTLAATCEDLRRSGDDRRLQRLVAREQRKLGKRIRRRHRRLYGERPRRFAVRLEKRLSGR
ncbi:MAG: CHAD domain-containing protein [Gammaproteobacteria bacterium]|nr:MAG: CHAD domain-containing protein [Gammaproteobacteria bacterium]